MQYVIPHAKRTPELRADWNSPAWADVPSLAIAQFHPRSSSHRPRTAARLLWSDEALHVLFRVQDQFVRSVRTRYQDMVCRDSCVELFLEPLPGRGYFNFEFNCGGVLLLYHVEDATPTENGPANVRPVDIAHGRLVRIAATMSSVTPVEIPDPIEWRLEATIPWTLFEPYIGPVHPRTGGRCRGNLFKCGSEISHPHWASWSSIGDTLNFHQPDRFGSFLFGG